MSAHTPGPWSTSRIGNAHRSPKERGMSFRVTATEANGPKRWDVAALYFKPSIEEAEANARLIAAAPEMLAALKALIDSVDRGETVIAWSWEYMQANNLKDGEGNLDAARSAIARAEGV